MLYLAILLTIVSAVLFAAGFGLAGYVIVTKIRESRQNSGSNSRTADNPSVP
jgi:phage shock protein PspC (stress-responsive transcriptional regulator)